ncbi:hypothetical protein VNO77_15644 [Canavalia gladiata]|uniref:Uncharacterized protein n=1 Tax=Canavalia gladiata TaxID=3824 RepID=A0AAN9M0G1_CANGL
MSVKTKLKAWLSGQFGVRPLQTPGKERLVRSGRRNLFLREPEEERPGGCIRGSGPYRTGEFFFWLELDNISIQIWLLIWLWQLALFQLLRKQQCEQLRKLGKKLTNKGTPPSGPHQLHASTSKIGHAVGPALRPLAGFGVCNLAKYNNFGDALCAQPTLRPRLLHFYFFV